MNANTMRFDVIRTAAFVSLLLVAAIAGRTNTAPAAPNLRADKSASVTMRGQLPAQAPAQLPAQGSRKTARASSAITAI